jgi:hypothetical protein
MALLRESLKKKESYFAGEIAAEYHLATPAGAK